MNQTSWVAIDTETSGLNLPIFTLEIAAQRMRGWERDGEPFRVLLNHDVRIEPGAEALHGYSRDYLRRHGMDPVLAHAAFRDYAEDLPLVAYNLGFDWKRVLVPEYGRLGIRGAGQEGFCALTLARRVLENPPNYRLETLKLHFQLSAERSHSGRGDVDTLVRLMQQVMAPRLRNAGICRWEEIRDFSRKTPVARCRDLIHGRAAPARKPRRRQIREGRPIMNEPDPKHPPEDEEKRYWLMQYQRWTDELIGICRGVLADGVLHDAEIRLLADWLEACPCKHVYPMNVVAARMEALIPGNQISEAERQQLKSCLEGLLPITFQ